MKRAWFKRCSLAQIACGVCFFAVMGAMNARAADAEAIAVAVGKMEVVTIPFAVEGFRVADPSVAKIETVLRSACALWVRRPEQPIFRSRDKGEGRPCTP